MRVNIIGAGGVGAAHAIAVQHLQHNSLSGIQLVGICDTDPKVRERYRQPLLVNIWGAFHEQAELPADLVVVDCPTKLPPAELCIVATPDLTHEDVVAQAWRIKGVKAVLVEKPGLVKWQWPATFVGYEWCHTELVNFFSNRDNPVVEVAMGHNHPTNRHVGIDLLPHVIRMIHNGQGVLNLNLTQITTHHVEGECCGVKVRATYNPEGKYESNSVRYRELGVGDVEWVITLANGEVHRAGWIPDAFQQQLRSLGRFVMGHPSINDLTPSRLAWDIEVAILQELNRWKDSH